MTEIENIENVEIAKKYKTIWEKELTENPQLFETQIISIHYTREEAISKELKIQKIFNVVKNPLFINLSYASINGFFGRDVSGENNPNYSKFRKCSKRQREILKNNAKQFPKIWMTSPEGISKQILKSDEEKFLTLGWTKNRNFIRKLKTTKQNYCFCILCKRKIQVNNIKNHYRWKH